MTDTSSTIAAEGRSVQPIPLHAEVRVMRETDYLNGTVVGHSVMQQQGAGRTPQLVYLVHLSLADRFFSPDRESYIDTLVVDACSIEAVDD